MTADSGRSGPDVPSRGPDARYRIPREPWFHEFDAAARARWEVPDGARVLIEAIDGWCGLIVAEGQLIESFPEGRTNGCTGPIAISGAEPGDTLVIDIESITIVDEVGITALMRGWGLLGDRLPAPRTRLSRITNGQVIYAEAVRLPVRPMIGTIGVSPATGSIPTLVPGKHGGNMDLPQIGPGARVYLPVSVPGAMLGLGDAKALSGDGELAAAGVEVSVEVAATLKVLHDLRLPTPMVHVRDTWISIGTAETLEEASREAALGMVAVLEPLLGLDWTDTYAVIGLAGSLRVAQLANPLVTVALDVADRLFPPGWPEMRGSLGQRGA